MRSVANIATRPEEYTIFKWPQGLFITHSTVPDIGKTAHDMPLKKYNATKKTFYLYQWWLENISS